MENKQTAVGWLFEKLWDTPKDKFNWFALLQEAKDMERSDINVAYHNGVIDGINELPIRNYYDKCYGTPSQID